MEAVPLADWGGTRYRGTALKQGYDRVPVLSVPSAMSGMLYDITLHWATGSPSHPGEEPLEIPD